VVGVLIVGGLFVAAVSNGGFQDLVGSSAAAEACDIADGVVATPSTAPDPTRSATQARTLGRALESADTAAMFDGQYESLRDEIESAQASAKQIAALPRDTATWSPAQQQRAAQAQTEFNESAKRISSTCSTIDVPFEDEFNGPTV
jgi:hypothetical protein